MGFLNRWSGPPDVADLKARGDAKGLVKALDFKDDYTARVKAVDALGDLGDPCAIPALLELAGDEEEPILRAYAAFSLAKLGDSRGVPFLLVAVERGPGCDVAARALGQLGCVEAVAPLVHILRELRVDQDAPARFWLVVVDALGAIGDPGAVDALLDWQSNLGVGWLWDHRDDLYPKFRTSVVNALASCGQHAVPTLVAHQSSVPEAALALAMLDWTPESDDERLASALSRHQWAEAAEVGPSAVAPLLAELKGTGSSDVDGRASEKIIEIARALESIGDARAVEPLVQVLSSDLRGLSVSGHARIRAAIADALGSIGEPAIQPLVTMIGEPGRPENSLKEAARALALCGPKGLEQLGGIVREHAEAHRRYGWQSPRPDNPDFTGWRASHAARQALVSNPNSLPVVRAMLDDENESVRADAEELVAEMTKQQP
jgi:HEAT repeat protein